MAGLFGKLFSKNERRPAGPAGQPVDAAALERIRKMASEGEVDAAIESLLPLLDENPDALPAWALYSNLARGKGDVTETMRALENVVRLKPDYAEAWWNLGAMNLTLARFPEAIEQSRKAVELEPELHQAWHNLAFALSSRGRTGEAIECYLKALEIEPGFMNTIENLAGLYERSNRADDALRLIERGFSVQPDSAVLRIVKARLLVRDDRREDARELIEDIETGGLPARWRAERAFVLGSICDRTGDYEHAVRYFEESNAQNRSTMPPDTSKELFIDEIRQMHEKLTPDWVRSFSHVEVQDNITDPVFVVGFPRSGTTLLGQIMDSHPGLTTLEERPIVVDVINQIAERPSGYPQVIAELTQADIESFRKGYYDKVAGYLPSSGEARIVDKLPLSIVRVPLVHRLFPNADFVFVARHPRDACLSAFMQVFRPNNAMANFFEMDDTVALYNRVMDLWERSTEVLPIRHHAFRYENLVDDFQGEVGRLLDFLGLPWDDAVSQYHARAGSGDAINTPSYHQVVQPIYRHARYRWKNYSGFFGAEFSQLDRWVRKLGYGD